MNIVEVGMITIHVQLISLVFKKIFSEHKFKYENVLQLLY